MPLANLWGKLNPTNLIAEFVIVTLSVVVALAGDKYLAHRATLEQEQVALELIHEGLKDLALAHDVDLVVVVALQKEGSIEAHEDEDELCHQPAEAGEEGLGRTSELEENHDLLIQVFLQPSFNLIRQGLIE